MFDAARFWLDMGVDGFRLDAIGTLFEDPSLEDHHATLTQESSWSPSTWPPSPRSRLRCNASIARCSSVRRTCPRCTRS